MDGTGPVDLLAWFGPDHANWWDQDYVHAVVVRPWESLSFDLPALLVGPATIEVEPTGLFPIEARRLNDGSWRINALNRTAGRARVLFLTM